MIGDLGGFAGLFRLDTHEVQAARCSPRPPTASAPSWSSRSRWTSTTRSASTWSRWSSTTWSRAAPSRCSCSTTSPAARSCRSKVAEIGAGIADGCRYAGCALLGGETAEHPGVLRPRRVRPLGDRRRRGRGETTILGRGPGRGRRRRHRDALVRPALQRLLAGPARAARRRPDAAGHRDRGLRPPAHARRGAAHPDQDLRQGLPRSDRPRPTCGRCAHVTGGGIPGNLVRVLPEHVDAIVDRATWRPQPIFDLMQRKGRIDEPEMESTFNMGVGMFAIVVAGRRRPGAGVPDAAAASTRGRPARSSRAPATVQMVGSHTRRLIAPSVDRSHDRSADVRAAIVD